jgi:lipopolysaccharide/colanic/teichoic acid biosynthesis glycosyltransferase
MTCLWQTAHNRNEVRFEDWMNLDLECIDNWSLKLDFMIHLKTLPSGVFRGRKIKEITNCEFRNCGLKNGEIKTVLSASF